MSDKNKFTAFEVYNQTVNITSLALILMYSCVFVRVAVGSRYSFIILMISLLLASNIGNVVEVKFGAL